MTIEELIAALNSLKEVHGGGAKVNVWQYDGGLDALCDVAPLFDAELQCVVLDCTRSERDIRR